jgi:transposase
MMALNLSVSQHAEIQHMIEVKRFTHRQIADVANCSIDAVEAISRNLRDFGSTRAPGSGGRPPFVTPVMREALLEHLLRKLGLSLKEMEVYFWDEFEVSTTKSSISRTLRSAKWSKKKARAIAKGRSVDLRDFYLYSISLLRSY